VLFLVALLQDWLGARQATLDFRRQQGIGEGEGDGKGESSRGEQLVAVYHDLQAGEVPRGVWWQKIVHR
jgi:hypothetical protein